MSKNIKVLLAFVTGGVIGSLITTKLVKKHYERVADEEIASYKEYYSKKQESRVCPVNDEEEEEKREPATKSKIMDYSKRVASLGYKDYDEEGDAETVEEPELITPDEFGELDYETSYLSYYADKVLADELDDIVADIEGTIGYHSLLHFGDHEEEIVHVRNHRLRVDYEVALDNRNYYEDIKGVSPADE